MDTTIVNAVPVTVTYLNGNTESVDVKRLSIGQLFRWAKLMKEQDTPQLVALCTDRKPAWIDTLTDESFSELTQQSVAVNFQRAMTLAKRDPIMANLMGPVVRDSINLLVGTDGILAGLDLKRPSPSPAPSVSAKATGTESSS